MVSSVSASAAVLSVRQRRMQGNRTATPDLASPEEDVLNCCGKMPSLRRAGLPGSFNLPKQLRTSPSPTSRGPDQRAAAPDLHFNLEMITRDPLQVPCVTSRYWETFPDLPGRHLARPLRLVRNHVPSRPLPRINALPPQVQLRTEDENVSRCLTLARAARSLGGFGSAGSRWCWAHVSLDRECHSREFINSSPEVMNRYRIAGYRDRTRAPNLCLMNALPESI